MMHKIYEIFAIKPKIISKIPSWMLPSHLIHEIRKRDDVAIGEFAGRDSFAAVIKAVKEHKIKAIVPTIAYTGSEYGNIKITIQKVEEFKKILKKIDVEMYPIVFLGDPNLWHTLCGRFISKHFKEYGEYSPCVGCHLYLHAIRIPLSYILDVEYIIAGERESHNGKIKVNQCKVALDVYMQFIDEFNKKLLLPVRYIENGEEIEELLGIKWDEGKEQVMCVLSKNYLDEQKMPYYKEDAIKKYLINYATAILRKKIKKYLEEITF